MVRDIGTGARKEIERELGTRVHLDLTVKVRRHWRRDEGLLDRLGHRRVGRTAPGNPAIAVAFPHRTGKVTTVARWDRSPTANWTRRARLPLTSSQIPLDTSGEFG